MIHCQLLLRQRDLGHIFSRYFDLFQLDTIGVTSDFFPFVPAHDVRQTIVLVLPTVPVLHCLSVFHSRLEILFVNPALGSSLTGMLRLFQGGHASSRELDREIAMDGLQDC